MNDKTDPSEEKVRRVVVSTQAKVIFSRDGAEPETVTVGRDVFSVMDAITAKLAQTKSKEEMESIRVAVRSFENEEKSEPLPEGGKRWEGPYMVGGAEVEGKTIPEAMELLAKVVLPADHAMLAFEQVASQCFTRSRMDGVIVVATFDGVPTAAPLFNTMKPVTKENIVSIYRAVLKVADSFRKAAVVRFKDTGVSDSDFDSDVKVDVQKAAEEHARKIVLPSGLPADMAGKGVVTPQEARKDQVRVIGLT